MTEAEWLACENPNQTLKAARFRNYRRKSRLFAVACCRYAWAQLVDERSRAAVDVAERHADGAATDGELAAAADGAGVALQEIALVLGAMGASPERAAVSAAGTNALHAAQAVGSSRLAERVRERWHHGPKGYTFTACRLERRGGLLSPVLGRWKVTLLKDRDLHGIDRPPLARLVRCIFPNPFRPVAFDPAWRTDNVLSLARHVYESRDFGALPILADALQDAGCDNADILEHCRGPGPHVRGCWVIDAILGKE